MYQSIHLFYLFIYLFNYLFICLFIYLFIYSFIYLLTYLFTYLFIYLLICSLFKLDLDLTLHSKSQLRSLSKLDLPANIKVRLERNCL